MDNEKYIPDAVITGQSYHDKADEEIMPVELLGKADSVVEQDIINKVNELSIKFNELLRQLKNNRYIQTTVK